jgi:hypothetical protein
MPDEPALRKHFGQPGGQRKGCGFPVAKLLVLVDAATGFIARTLALPLRTHDLSRVSAMHDALEPNDVFVGDRGFCSYVHLALLLQGNRHAVLRAHQRTLVSFKRGRPHAGQYPKGQRAGLPTSQWLRALGPTDQLVRWFKPPSRPSWCDAETFGRLPGAIQVREMRYPITPPGFRTTEVTLVTTLLDAERYSKRALAELYRQRWDVEKRLRELKITPRGWAWTCCAAGRSTACSRNWRCSRWCTTWRAPSAWRRRGGRACPRTASASPTPSAGCVPRRRVWPWSACA